MFNGFSIFESVIAALLLCGLIFLIVLLIKLKKNGGTLGNSRVDELTGIGNRKYIYNAYSKSIDKSYKSQYYVTYFSYDNQKIENYYGLDKANSFQKLVAKTINRSTNEYEYCSRIDDGVFLCILRCVDFRSAIDKINGIVELLNNKEAEVFTEYRTHIRAGIYRLEDKKESFDTVLSNAKLAYVQAYDTKTNSCVCSAELLKSESSRNRIREKLSFALDNNQFEMYFQFIYNVADKKFDSVEALSRWNNPEEGLLTPAYYISDIRKSKIIDRFDYYMIKKACCLLEEWEKTGVNDMKLSCNITRATISMTDFMENFMEIVNQYEFDHSKLLLEITEDALIDNGAMAHKNIVSCRNEGFVIALDDFGAGHSSVSDLCDYPVDIIKLDRHIISKSVTDRGGELLEGLIDLAHKLNIKVLCEGVETKEENKIAIKCGCDFVQGYYHSYVLSCDEAKAFYASHKK